MSNSVVIIVNITGSTASFLNGTFVGNLFLGAFGSVNVTFNRDVTGKIGTSNPTTIGPLLDGQSYSIFLRISTSNLTGVPPPVLPGATSTFTFNDNPSTIVNLPLLTGSSFITSTGNTGLIRCLHGSSLIEMEGGRKRIDQIISGDRVLSGDKLDEYVKVEDIAHCWLTFLNIDHDAIIFEPNSLGKNEPSERLIIDPGHPICTKKEYLEDGIDALRPAGTYYEELKGERLEPDQGQVLTKKWTSELVQEDQSRRYDLILEEPYNNYVANGIVVRTMGYKDHRYKEFV